MGKNLKRFHPIEFRWGAGRISFGCAGTGRGDIASQAHPVWMGERCFELDPVSHILNSAPGQRESSAGELDV